MDGLCNTAPPLCTRCQVNPRLPKQRWCRQCLTAAQRQRRAAQQATPAPGASSPVTHAALQAIIQAIPRVTQAPAPARPEAKRGLTEAPQAPKPSSTGARAPIEAPQPPEGPHTVAECALAVCQLCLPEVQDLLREDAAVLGCPVDQMVRLILDLWGRDRLRADMESPAREE